MSLQCRKLPNFWSWIVELYVRFPIFLLHTIWLFNREKKDLRSEMWHYQCSFFIGSGPWAPCSFLHEVQGQDSGQNGQSVHQNHGIEFVTHRSCMLSSLFAIATLLLYHIGSAYKTMFSATAEQIVLPAISLESQLPASKRLVLCRTLNAFPWMRSSWGIQLRFLLNVISKNFNFHRNPILQRKGSWCHSGINYCGGSKKYVSGLYDSYCT